MYLCNSFRRLFLAAGPTATRRSGPFEALSSGRTPIHFVTAAKLAGRNIPSSPLARGDTNPAHERAGGQFRQSGPAEHLRFTLELFSQSSHLLLVIDPHRRAGLTLKSSCSILEKFLLPFVEQRRIYPLFFAHFGDRLVFQKVQAQDLDFFRAAILASFSVAPAAFPEV
jgi:hypothetical protein